jgi:hypothetical protein
MIYYETKDIQNLSATDIKKHTWTSFKFFPLYDSKIKYKQSCGNISQCDKTNYIENINDHGYYCFGERNIIEYIDAKPIQINLASNQIFFSCFDELCMFIECLNISCGQIGILAIYKDKDKKEHMYKLYDPVYIKLLKITSSKKFTSNINQFYIELYQKNDLTLFLTHHTRFSNDVLFRVNTSFRTLSNNILNIYHGTRNKKNIIIHDKLTDSYKKIIHDIHNIYIINKQNDDEFGINVKSINVHDIYYLLKSIDVEFLILLYSDTLLLKINNPDIIDFIDTKCIHMLAQINLM